MATFLKSRKTEPATTFTHLPEVNYWAKQFKVTANEFHKAFVDAGYSLSAAIATFGKRSAA